MKREYAISAGYRYPTGVSIRKNGVNFSIFSRHARTVELLLYSSPTAVEPFQVIRLDPYRHRTYFFWHVFVEDLPSGVSYTWRVDGPSDTENSGFRFEGELELTDPWAKGVTMDLWDRRGYGVSTKQGISSIRASVLDNDYPWDGDGPLNHPMEDSIIYEMHVGGFTRHSSSGVSRPGSFSAVIEKIPYLKELGVTDVELMPCMAFDEQDVPDRAFYRGLRNYWGYSTHSFFSPHPGYCVSPDKGTHLREFRDMVKALHEANIGVILDVVLNHTAEGGETGPTINFKGLGNETFYHLDPEDKRRYRDYTGCGNTVNCNHPLVSNFLLQCLEYWVREMHVDGFRFDLASVLARGEDGRPMRHAPIVWNIEFSEVLARTKIIAEAWDAAGLYQVGAFPGFRWAEWNGRYRDTVRRFVRGDRGLTGRLATCVSGSSDLYESSGRLPINSVNFVTCHDGFTLADLVSHNKKHNEANQEKNRDGADENFSWNCGREGPTSDPEILELRKRQAKNFLAILMLSQGVPMILSGDEVLRTQRGNNNAYCQNNEISWFDWTLTKTNADMLRFTRLMIAFRKRHPCLRHSRFLTGRRREGARLPDVTWHGVRLHEPQWDNPDSRVLAYTLGATESDVHVMINMSETSERMAAPAVDGRRWFLAVDTADDSPRDILEPREQRPVDSKTVRVRPRSVVVLESRP